ncbi:hypothetical protein COT77_00990 [Candidatus Berkelbacteria bacterium CG10_big_fil_rev_8_21_14_0_10_41_12]|uniref:DM13 domain-containing protein n=1 Tax=Candidatus Berkelbacteria bacterium CG10_big_fil_rev_8_21_14_0_10_41_12 TaxID=1974513 RepID=A0A2M6WXM0_9BACT|nr:MAG: hypothetical protein COT77_00990 [Candidatus Berkelbacteria bacterium CG10_big_fil_rev_8_21_14_0_10_41_12]
MVKIFPLILIGVLFFSGCTARTSTNATPTPSAETNGVAPALGEKSNRVDITDPIINMLKENSSTSGGNLTEGANINQATINDEIGQSAIFRKDYQYEISGIIKITAVDKLSIEDFNYNGSCGMVSMILVNSVDKNAAITTVKQYPDRVTNDNFVYTLPEGVDLLQFNAVSIFCSARNKSVISTSFR